MTAVIRVYCRYVFTALAAKTKVEKSFITFRLHFRSGQCSG